jgi:succinate dehydrogenase flavin-adding protein (antitoxin of CptAB toxin-antitoxin module)
VWFGVAKVVDDAEIERLTKRGCTEITEEQYNSEVKKKAAQRSALDDYRQILAVPDAQLVAKAQPESSPKPPAEPPPVEQVVKAAPVPRRKSVVAP